MKFLKVYLFKTIEEQFPAGISMLSHCSQAWIEWPQFYCYSIESRTLQANIAHNYSCFIIESFLSFLVFKWFSQFKGVLNRLCQILHSSLFNRVGFETSELFMAVAHKKLFESSSHIEKTFLVLRFRIFME